MESFSIVWAQKCVIRSYISEFPFKVLKYESANQTDYIAESDKVPKALINCSLSCTVTDRMFYNIRTEDLLLGQFFIDYLHPPAAPLA